MAKKDATFVIQSDGTISQKDCKQTLGAVNEDIVVWIFRNDYAGQVTVVFDSWKLKGNAVAAPVSWLYPVDGVVRLANQGDIQPMVGKVTVAPATGKKDSFSGTLKVTAGGTVSFDPDLEVSGPPPIPPHEGKGHRRATNKKSAKKSAKKKPGKKSNKGGKKAGKRKK